MNLPTRVGIVAFTLGSCALAAYLRLQEVRSPFEPAPSELFETIHTQILAIRAQHYQEAYLKASSQYMDSHGLEGFLETARADCAVVRQALRWEFGPLRDDADATSVEVRFFMPGGDATTATYTVIHENRQWKIDHISFGQPVQPRALPGVRL
jgi:hypothetical protein